MMFKRRQYQKTALRFHSTLVTPKLLVRIVPDKCKCSDECEYKAVEVLSTRFIDNLVEIEIVPYLPNNYRICVSPYGWTDTVDFFVYAATLQVDAPDACIFDGLADTPCQAKVCEGEERTSEACA